jgi:hypothetical protein
VTPFRSPDQHAKTPQHKGRFPNFDVLDETDRWDDVTAGVVLARLSLSTDLSFFTLAETAAAGPLVDLLMAQDCDPKIPVLAMVDARLALGETDGWRYEDLPEDAQAWRETLAALDADAHDLGGVSFGELVTAAQMQLIQKVQDAAQDAGTWRGFPAKHVWSLWTRYCSAAFYSHPWAWNEIGFSGPAYPRGYKNRHVGGRERWEVADTVDADPVPFANRVEHERREHYRAGGFAADGEKSS